MTPQIMDRDTTQLTGQLRRLEMAVDGLAVTNGDTYEDGIEIIRTITAYEGEVERYFGPDVKAAHAVHKGLVAKRDAFLHPLALFVKRVKAKCQNWKDEQDRIKKEAERELELLAEAQRKQKLVEANLAMRRGEVDHAETIRQEADQIAAPALPSLVPAVFGAGSRTTWTGVCDDPMVLLKAVAAGDIPLVHTVITRGKGEVTVPLFEVNQAVLDYYATSQHDAFAWPGCRATSKNSLTVKR